MKEAERPPNWVQQSDSIVILCATARHFHLSMETSQFPNDPSPCLWMPFLLLLHPLTTDPTLRVPWLPLPIRIVGHLAFYLSLASWIVSVPNPRFSVVRYVPLRDDLLWMRMMRIDSRMPTHYRYGVNEMGVYGSTVVGVWVDTRLVVDCSNHTADTLDVAEVPVDHRHDTPKQDDHLHRMLEAGRTMVVADAVVVAVVVHASTWVGVSGVLVRDDVVNRHLWVDGTIPESVVDHELVVVAVVVDCTRRRIGYDMDVVVVDHSYHANPYGHSMVEPQSFYIYTHTHY